MENMLARIKREASHRQRVVGSKFGRCPDW
jgi:hypothetical protein